MIANSRHGPVRVGVLVGLPHQANSGGHMKCWEHFADVAARLREDVDLTLYVLGDVEREWDIAENVRYCSLPPVFSTGRLLPAVRKADQTDIAPRNGRLASHLAEHDVLHATDAWFAFARTALTYHRTHGVPLVMSTHTDVPGCARAFTRKTLENALGNGTVGKWLLMHQRVPEYVESRLERRLVHYFRHCDHVLASSGRDYELASQALPAGSVSRLRRGIDRDLFRPQDRDRMRLRRDHQIPEDRFVVLFVGRLDAAKRPMLVAEATRQLATGGVGIHAVFVGEGPLQAELERLSGPSATFLGGLPQERLHDVYACADVFVFPSEAEVVPNVVIEAKSSGLPVLLLDNGRGRQLVEDGRDGILIDSVDAAAWALAIDELRRHEELRCSLGRAAREQIERHWPGWEDVLREDVLPVWRRLQSSP